MQMFMYSAGYGPAQVSTPPVCYVPPHADYDERVWSMIDFMVPHLTDYFNPSNPGQFGAQFVFFQGLTQLMSVDYVMLASNYLREKQIISAYSVQLEQNSRQYIVFPNILASELADTLKEFLRLHRRPTSGPER